uniref:hypothetical protein n=1 Tax=Diaporthe sojae TaxID=165439 RepID=UPI0024109162
LPIWSGKSNMGIKLPNSGDSLKLLVLSCIWKYASGWSNYSGIVTSQKMNERKMGNRGSKIVLWGLNLHTAVKEQRVYGSWCGNRAMLSHLRCTLTDFERNHKNKILTTQLVNKRSYSTSLLKENNAGNNLSSSLIIDPHFLTGFADAEGSFVLSITKSKNVKSGWVIKPRFQIHLHIKDLFVLKAIKNFLGVGKIYITNAGSVEFRVFSIRELKVVLDHFDKFPLISQKYGDFCLFKQAYQLLINGEHLTPEGLRKVISIRASINNGLSEALKEASPDITIAERPTKENISICNSQWLAGFTSGEGSFGVKVRSAGGNSKAVIELTFQINQHVRDTQLIDYIAEYLGCGKVYKHSVNAIVYRVSRRSDLTGIIIPFFIKNPILGIKALDFKDFCSIFALIESKAYYNQEGLDQVIRIKSHMNTGRV